MSIVPLTFPRLFLDSELDPDPSKGAQHLRVEGDWTHFDLFPHAARLLRGNASGWKKWCGHLHLHQSPDPLEVRSEVGDEVELVLDFGTEIEGEFEMHFRSPGKGSLSISFGESEWEAREWGPQSTCVDHRPRKKNSFIEHEGSHIVSGEAGGFRFVRIRALGFYGTLTLDKLVVHARLYGKERLGHFTCEDPFLQRLWNACIYTARVCTRGHEFWDGPKRDRLHWWGDAHACKEAFDLGYFDPTPSERCFIDQLPVNSWASQIPAFNFEAVGMFRSHLDTYGTDRAAIPEMWKKVRAAMDWALTTQTGSDLRIERREDVPLFFGIGFIDWTQQPMGGRLEEIGPVQFFWLEALQSAAECAALLKDDDAAARYSQAAGKLRPLLRKLFLCPGGFHHTLNLCEPQGTPWHMPCEPNVHYQKTYVEKIQYGPSGPSLHSNARAVLAGLTEPGEEKEILETLRSPELPPIVTSYYQYYIQEARARCGDVAGAVEHFKDYFGKMLDGHQSSCIWESFEPEVKHGVEHFSLGTWPKSLCHPWGTGFLRFVVRHVAGISNLNGGGCLEVDETNLHPVAFRLEIPTPAGKQIVERISAGSAISRHVLTIAEK